MTNRLPTVGGDDDQWGQILNDFLSVAHNSDGTLITSAVSAAGAQMVSNLDTDGTLAANSDTKYASQKATKTYVDTAGGNYVTLSTDQTVSGIKTFTGGVTIDNGVNGKVQALGYGGGIVQAFKNSTDGYAAMQMLTPSSGNASLKFGPGGSTVPDTSIDRTAANELTTNANLIINNASATGGITVEGSGGGLANFMAAPGDTQPAAIFGYQSGAGLAFGAGGSTPVDVVVGRAGVNELGFGSATLKAISDPAEAQDAATKNYVDTTTAPSSSRYHSALQTFWDGLLAGTANTVFFGDSITYGFAINWAKTYPQLFDANIMARYGGAALSWLPADGAATQINDSGRGVSSTGSPTFTGRGLGAGSVKMTGASDSLTWTSQTDCTVVEVWYKKDSTQGKMNISVDGGAATTIDTGAASLSWGNKWTSGTLTSGVHSITVSPATGGSFNAGLQVEVEAFALDPSTTPRVYNASRFGAGTQHEIDFTTTNPHADDSLNGIDPRLVVVHLGTNNLGAGTGYIPTYKGYLQSLITRCNSLPSGAPAIVIAKLPPNNSTATTVSAMQPWWDAIDELAASNSNVIVWDLYQLMGKAADNVGGLFFDSGLGTTGPGDLHPSPAGDALMAESLSRLVLPPNYSSGTVSSLIGDVTGDVTGNLTGNITGGVNQIFKQITGDYTMTVADQGKVIFYTGSSNITVSLVAGGSLIGSTTSIVQLGSGKIHVDASSLITAYGLFSTTLTTLGPLDTVRAGDSLTFVTYYTSTSTAIMNLVLEQGDALAEGNGVITASQTADINQGYLCNSSSLITVTLPTTAAVGSTLEVTAMGTGGFKIAQNASGVIHFGSSSTTTGTGGYISSTAQYDSIKLVCSVANNEWIVTTSIGNLTVA